MTPYFSVIVPVYKVEAFLRPCVDSILTQTFPDFELILVDDGSPDGCPAICEEYAEKDERVRVIHQENAGVTQARKSGLLSARADYVCFVDSDDYVVPSWLETVYSYIENNNYPDLLIYGYIVQRPDHNLAFPPRPAAGYYNKERLRTEIYPYMINDSRVKEFNGMLLPPCLWAKPGKRTLYIEHYLQDERIQIPEDVPMIYEVLLYADSVYICPECLYYYYRRDDSAVSKYNLDFCLSVKLDIAYMQARIGVLAKNIQRQINAWGVVQIMRMLRSEVRQSHSLRNTYRRCAKCLKETELLSSVCLKGLPFHITVFTFLLKCHIYYPALILLKFF